MTQRVQIDEVIAEAAQGKSGGVFRCIGDDGNIYYVKGYRVGRLDQAKEWICGNLAKAFGLPIADFCLVDVCEELYEVLPRELKHIGFGPCFASREVSQNQWLERGVMAREVPKTWQNDVLVFDRWIRNEDRNQGNSNLLWVSHESQLVVIDHNLAFDPDFNVNDFFKLHVFSEARERVFGDLVAIAEYKMRMEKALLSFQSSIDTYGHGLILKKRGHLN